MARLNVFNTTSRTTYEGGRASKITPTQALRRSVMSCLLWEKEFYESGEDIATRISKLVQKVPLVDAVSIAREASQKMHLRHAPLYLTALICQQHNKNPMLRELVRDVVTRVDSMGEIIAMVAQINNVPAKLSKDQLMGKETVQSKIAKSIQKGLADCFHKFDEYQFGKYNREGAVNLKDVVMLVHPKPRDAEEGALFKKILEDKLATPDTWEVELSAGKDKKETFERLLTEERNGYPAMPYLAALRNLRNMEKAGVDKDLVFRYLRARKGARRVLPFRYLAAARHAVWAKDILNECLLACIEDLPKFEGKTAILVDVSGSMATRLSAKSDLTRMDAAATLAAVFPAEENRVFSFSDHLVEVNRPTKGIRGIEEIIHSQSHGGTQLLGAIKNVERLDHFDRIVVITDEQAAQDHGTINSLCQNINNRYIINVASAKNGIGYEEWSHIDGFSENVLRFMKEFEYGLRSN